MESCTWSPICWLWNVPPLCHHCAARLPWTLAFCADIPTACFSGHEDIKEAHPRSPTHTGLSSHQREPWETEWWSGAALTPCTRGQGLCLNSVTSDFMIKLCKYVTLHATSAQVLGLRLLILWESQSLKQVKPLWTQQGLVIKFICRKPFNWTTLLLKMPSINQQVFSGTAIWEFNEIT